MSDASGATKSKRYLSIVWKLIIPTFLVFGSALLIIYNMIDEEIETSIAILMENDVFTVIDQLDQCVDPENVLDYHDNFQKDEDYEAIQSCFKRVTDKSANVRLYTYFVDHQDDPIIGVVSDNVSSVNILTPGQPLSDEGMELFFGEGFGDADIIENYMLDGLIDTAFEEQALVNADGEIIYTGYAPVLGTEGFPAGLIVQILANDSINEFDFIQIVLGFGIGIALLVLVVVLYIVASRNTSALRKLSAAAAEVGDGNYEDLDLTGGMWFDDEVSRLEQIFDDMVQKVYEREKALVEKVTELKIFIDQGKKKEDVENIMSSDMFKDFKSRAQEMRERARGKK